MVTIIDMITGKVTHSSPKAAEPAQAADIGFQAWDCPSLALQEINSEPREVRMPPELAHISVAEFLGE